MTRQPTTSDNLSTSSLLLANTLSNIWLYRITLGFFSMGALIAMQGLNTPLLSRTFHLSINSVVMIDGFTLLVSLIINLLSARWLSYLGINRCLQVSCLLLTVTTFLIYSLFHFSHPSILLFLLCQCITGIGIGLIYPTLNQAILQQSWSTKKKSSILSIINVGWNLGFFGCCAFTHYVAKLHHPTYTFFLVATCFLLCAINAPKIKTIYLQTNQTNHKSTVSLNQTLLLIGFMLTIITFTQNTVEYWIPIYLRIDAKQSLAIVAGIMAFFGIGQAIGRIMLGTLVLPFIKTSLAIFIMLLSLTCIIPLILHHHSIFVYQIILLNIGFASSSLLPCVMSLYHKKNAGVSSKITSFFITMNTSGSILGLLATSILSHFLNHAVALLSASILLVIAILFLARFSWSSQIIFKANPQQ